MDHSEKPLDHFRKDGMRTSYFNPSGYFSIDARMRIFDDNQVVVTYTIPATKGNLVQDKRFYQALKNDRQMNKRKYHHGRRSKGRAKRTISPQKPDYDMDVQIRPLHSYDDYVQGKRCTHDRQPGCRTHRIESEPAAA
jgi:hypothetical protein